MTDRDEIELPPLPPFAIAPIADEQTVRDYARAAVLADRKRRAEQAKPKVHSKWIELASYHSTSTMLHICWTDDGRAWIESEDSRSLARSLRSMYCDPLILAAADALDGGTQ